MKRGFHVLAGMEAVGLKHVFDPAVESLNHAVGLWMRRRGQTVFDAKVRAEQVELVFACRGAFAQTEETVSKFPSVPDFIPPLDSWERAIRLPGCPSSDAEKSA